MRNKLKGSLPGTAIAAGIVSGLLALTGPPGLILQAAANGNFTTEQTIHWMFAVYVIGGSLGVLLPLYWRMPIVGAHSITGVAFLATVTAQFTYHQLIGSYVMAGLLMVLVGALGIFAKLMDYVPKEVIAAMLAGMITKYMVNFVVSVSQIALVGAGALAAYFYFSKWNKRVPPMVAAILSGSVILLLTQPLLVKGTNTAFVVPSIQVPEFSVLSFLSVSVPLTLLILSNDAAVGIGALEQNDFHPPVNRVIVLGGVFTMLAGFLGGQSANVGGMMSAICSDEGAGPKEKRYIASVVSGCILIIFGIFAWKLVPVIQSLPQAFISLLIGFALLGVFGNSLNTSFSNPRLKLSVAFAFIIALANVSIFNISAPIWSFVVGTFIARFIESPKPEKAETTV